MMDENHFDRSLSESRRIWDLQFESTSKSFRRALSSKDFHRKTSTERPSPKDFHQKHFYPFPHPFEQIELIFICTTCVDAENCLCAETVESPDSLWISSASSAGSSLLVLYQRILCKFSTRELSTSSLLASSLYHRVLSTNELSTSELPPWPIDTLWHIAVADVRSIERKLEKLSTVLDVWGNVWRSV